MLMTDTNLRAISRCKCIFGVKRNVNFVNFASGILQSQKKAGLLKNENQTRTPIFRNLFCCCVLFFSQEHSAGRAIQFSKARNPAA